MRVAQVVLQFVDARKSYLLVLDLYLAWDSLNARQLWEERVFWMEA